jgi:DNA-binding IclR family transcriptional regulator
MSYNLSTTVLKAFQILEFIGDNQPVQPPTIIKGLDLNRTNVHRLLATLSEIGYVVKTHEGFSLTLKLLKLGRTSPLSTDLRNTAKPFMIDLINRVGENIYLCVRVEDMVLAIDDLKSSHQITLNPNTTYSFPIHSCASGKLFLSEMPRAERLDYIETLPLEKFGRNTITDKLKLHRQAEDAREKGFATDMLEFSDDVISIAAPIYNYDQKIIATIAISGPGSRVKESDIAAHTPDLLATAQELSRCFGSEK